MAYNFSFADNGLYGADDLNKITSRLVTAGVQDTFENGTPYNLSAFNESGALLYTEGVVPESVSTLKVVSGNGENTILINPGTAFFKDGSVIEIEEGGHELSFVSGVKNYVYLKNNLVSENASYPVCSESIPTGDFVLLAEIEENGEICDKRTYAKGKLPGYASCADYTLEITDTVNTPGGSFTEQRTYDIGNNNYRFLVVYQEGTVTLDALRDKCNYILGIYDIKKGKLFSVDCMSSFSGLIYTSLSQFKIYRDEEENANAGITLSDGKLTLDISGYTRNRSSLTYTLYLF